MPISVRWATGRLEIETTAPDRAGSLSAGLVLLPATGAYAARLTVRGADLDELSGLPALAAHLAGPKLPVNLRGRLTADVDLSGRGADLTALRGRGAIPVWTDSRSRGTSPAVGWRRASSTPPPPASAWQTFALEIPGGTIQGRGSVGFTDGRLDVPLQADLKDWGAFARGFGLPLLGGKAALQGRLTGSREAPRFQGRLTWRNPLRLGGMGSVPGALIGGLVIGVVEAVTGFFFGESLGQLGIFIIFIVVLLVRPRGLFGASA